MAKKLKLKIEDLKVESFETTEGATPSPGTVFGHDPTDGSCTYTLCGPGTGCQWTPGGESCESQGICTAECATETQYTNGPCTCTNDTPSIYCQSLAVQCDTNIGYTCQQQYTCIPC
jgi:hypothetical protein